MQRGHGAYISDFINKIFSMFDINQIASSMNSEYPELNLPKNDPYKVQNVPEYRVLNPDFPINFVIRETGSSIYGLENLKVHQIK